jgi:outer membrane receptor protein involved in Fe transport
MVWRWVPSPTTMVAMGADGSLQDGGSLFYSLVNGERGDSLRTNKAERAGSFGFFVEAATALAEAWSLSAGVRFDRQHYRSSVFPAGSNLTTRVESLTFGHATPHLGLSYRIDDRQSAFVSLSGGLEVPAFNEVDPPPGIGAADLNPLLKPMTSTTYEVGHRFRGKVLDQWDVSTSAAVFLIAVRDEIVPFNNGAWFLSAGQSRRLGAEVAATIRSEDGVEAYVALTAMRAEYREFSSSAGTFSGNAVPGIPGHTLVIRLSGEVAEGLSIEIGGRRVGAMTVDDANTLNIPSSNVLDGAVSWRTRALGASITVRGDVRNLLDAAHTSGAFINPATRPTLPAFGSGSAPAYREPGLPRNFVLTVSVGS